MKKLKKTVGPILVIVVVVLLMSVPRIVKIQEVDCRNQYGECSNTISERVSSIKGDSAYSSKKRLQEILGKEVSVKKFSLHFQLPARYVVNIIERKPKYGIKENTKNEILLADEDGRIINSSAITTLPLLEVDRSLPNIGEKLDDKVLFAAEIVFSVSQLNKVNDAKVDGNNLIIELLDGPTVIFPIEGDKDYLVGALTLVLGELNQNENGIKMKNPNIHTVDLRYKNPVLR